MTEALHQLEADVEEAEEVVKALLLGGGEGAPGESRQILEDPFADLGGEIIEPPANPLVWASAMERNTRLHRAIHTYARNTVGLGWEIVPVIDVNDETPQADLDRIAEETARLEALFLHPNREMPFTTLMYLVKIDEEATGNGYIEVTRNNAGEIDGLYHAASHTIRIRTGGRGFVQIRGTEQRYFKHFGDERAIDAITGREAAGGGLAPERRATELIHFKIYSPRSSFYGLPRFVAAAPAIAGNRLAAQRNVAFFENDAVGRLAITVSGGRLTADSIDMIRQFLAKGKGPENAHRVMVLQSESKKIGIGDTKAQINVVPLTVGVTEDASFLGYRQANDEEIREAFGIAKVFFTTEDVNRATAAVSRQITNEQEFEPDRLDKEFRLNHTILHARPFEAELVEFRFKRPKISDPVDRARIEDLYARHGALTPNDLRDSLGLDPYPEEFAFADKPLPVALLELQLGARAAAGAKSATALLDELLELRKELAARNEGRRGLGGPK
ncbi:MAG: phage portal protein [Trueperaceae bacterium]|nr:phage portal protein [Trueperaceae bacterium]